MKLLVVDAPNIDVAIARSLGRAPTYGDRPDWSKIIEWLVRRCSEEDYRACMFVNQSQASRLSHSFQTWFDILRSIGWYVFVKPKDDQGKGDIDDDMLAYISRHLEQGDVSEVIIASHDAKNFRAVLQQLRASKIQGTIMGFFELLNGYSKLDLNNFVDLESIGGAFKTPLPRTRNLNNLPPAGMLFAPTRSRQAFVGNYVCPLPLNLSLLPEAISAQCA